MTGKARGKEEEDSCHEIFVRSYMLYDGFPHMFFSDSVFVGDVKDLSEASALAIGFSSVVLLWVSKYHMHKGILLWPGRSLY